LGDAAQEYALDEHGLHFGDEGAARGFAPGKQDFSNWLLALATFIGDLQTRRRMLEDPPGFFLGYAASRRYFSLAKRTIRLHSGRGPGTSLRRAAGSFRRTK